MPKTQAISETELIQKCKKGDLQHQEKLYKHFFGFAMGVGLRYLTNRNDTMEVVNDAFIKVFNSIGTFKDEQLFKPWLRKIIVNTAIDQRRKDLKHLYQTNLDDAAGVSDPPKALEYLNAQDILKLLNTVPDLQRMVFNLYEIDGYCHEEIGELLKIPASSSRVNLSRAKEKLRIAYKLEQAKDETNRSETYR